MFALCLVFGLLFYWAYILYIISLSKTIKLAFIFLLSKFIKLWYIVNSYSRMIQLSYCDTLTMNQCFYFLATNERKALSICVYCVITLESPHPKERGLFASDEGQPNALTRIDKKSALTHAPFLIVFAIYYKSNNYAL